MPLHPLGFSDIIFYSIIHSLISNSSPVANMTNLVFLYKVFFKTVSKSLFSADSKSDCSQTQKVERFSKNR